MQLKTYWVKNRSKYSVRLIFIKIHIHILKKVRITLLIIININFKKCKNEEQFGLLKDILSQNKII